MTELDESAKRALAWPGDPETPVESCTPALARQQYLDGFADIQRPLEDVAEMLERHRGAIRLKIWRGRAAPRQGAPALLCDRRAGNP
jgi:acetyl esterase